MKLKIIGDGTNIKLANADTGEIVENILGIEAWQAVKEYVTITMTIGSEWIEKPKKNKPKTRIAAPGKL